MKESRWTEFGKEFITHIYTPGEYLGWPGLITEEPHRSVASALEDSTLKLIPREEVVKLLEKRPDLYRVLLRHAISEHYDLVDKLINTAYESVRKRMAFLLAELHRKFENNGVAEIHLLREDIAAMAGVSKETAIRVLSSFKEEDLITITNNAIHVHSVDKLENIVG